MLMECDDHLKRTSSVRCCLPLRLRLGLWFPLRMRSVWN